MRAVKNQILVILLAAISVGLVNSQLCATVCALYGCLPSATTKNAVAAAPLSTQTEPSGTGCHKHSQSESEGSGNFGRSIDKGSAPLSSGQSSPSGPHDCPGHAEQTAIVSTVSSPLCAATHMNLQILGGELQGVSNPSFNVLAAKSFITGPDRSPPRRALSALRI